LEELDGLDISELVWDVKEEGTHKKRITLRENIK